MSELQTQPSVARPPGAQRRRTPRYTFVEPIPIQVGGSTHTVLTHDISRGGVGFYATESLVGQDITFSLPTVLGRTVSATAQVVWARRCSQDWHMNGAQLTAPTSFEWTELRIAAAASELNRRRIARQSMFAPVKIRYPSAPEVVLAHCRDISTNGIGLFQTEPPIDKFAIVSFEHGGIENQFRAELAWVEQHGDRFFMSGWRLNRSRLLLPGIHPPLV